MAAHWWWTWSCGLPSTAYANSHWSLTSTTNVVTNNGTNLNAPSASAQAPGEDYNLRVTGTNYILTPPFWNGSVSAGWYIQRWNANSETLSTNVTTRILEIMNGGSTTIIRLAPSASTITSTLVLTVNGTTVGTSLNVFGDSSVVLAIDFDLTVSPAQAGLVVDGQREITRAGGSGGPTVVDRVKIGSGTTGASAHVYWGDPAIFNALSDFTDDADTQNVWCACLAADGVTDGDNSWTPSSGTELGVLTDADPSTYTSSTSADTLSISFQNTTDKMASWGPTNIYGVAVYAYGTADVISDTTLDLIDGGGSVDTSNDTLNAVGHFIGVWTAVASDAAAWEAADINLATGTYSVA